MKFNKKYKVSPEYEYLFEFNGIWDELEHEARMIAFRSTYRLKETARKVVRTVRYWVRLVERKMK